MYEYACNVCIVLSCTWYIVISCCKRMALWLCMHIDFSEIGNVLLFVSGDVREVVVHERIPLVTGTVLEHWCLFAVNVCVRHGLLTTRCHGAVGPTSSIRTARLSTSSVNIQWRYWWYFPVRLIAVLVQRTLQNKWDIGLSRVMDWMWVNRCVLWDVK